jgi:hypothetical protein
MHKARDVGANGVASRRGDTFLGSRASASAAPIICGSSEFLFDLVEPLEVGPEDVAAQRVQQPELGATMGKLRLAPLGIVEDRREFRDLFAK